MRPRKNWPFFFNLVAMGLSINHSCDLLGVHRNSVFGNAQRKAEFRRQLNQALEMQVICLRLSPFHFVHPVTLEPILCANFERIPRKPPWGIRGWVREQMGRNPLASLAA